MPGIFREPSSVINPPAPAADNSTQPQAAPAPAATTTPPAAPAATPPAGTPAPSQSAQTSLQTLLGLLDGVQTTTTETAGAPTIGSPGNDLLAGLPGDTVARGGDGNDVLLGNDGNDSLFGDGGENGAVGGKGNDDLRGGAAKDLIFGDAGDDSIFGGAGQDQLSGGEGKDTFVYAGNVFADGEATPAGQTGIKALNKPDVVTDFTPGEDKFGFSKFDLGLSDFKFQSGKSGEIAGDGNLVVLTDPFPAAGAAARAIANNNNITSKEGVFAYFNSTLGLTRLVYSQNLADGGDISVLSNLDNQRGDAGLANISKFTQNDFSFV